MVSAPARREQVRCMVGKGLSQRRALAIVRMSASAYRYAPRPDHNVELRERIVALAQRHRRYGVGMIHLKLRQGGMRVNYKRVERLYQEAQLQVRRRKRKKVQPGERQPLVRPVAANQVWSMDFVFDRTAEGRVIKCLVIVDDATHEAVTIEVERAISGLGVTRVLDRLALSRGLPQVIRTDNGKEFCGKAMVIWAHQQGVQLRRPAGLDWLHPRGVGRQALRFTAQQADDAARCHPGVPCARRRLGLRQEPVYRPVVDDGGAEGDQLRPAGPRQGDLHGSRHRGAAACAELFRLRRHSQPQGPRAAGRDQDAGADDL